MANSDQASGTANVRRPLSPHLQVYRLLWNMVMSIVHRLTGVALYFGTLLLAIWLVAVASGPDAFALVQAFFASWLGRLILFGYTWALIHHMLGGVRHLIWDTGSGYDLGTIDLMCKATLVGSIIATGVIWYFGYKSMGAF